MADTTELVAEWERLKKLSHPQRRGYDFQQFIGSMFVAEHFKVERKPRAARPRQVDVFATRGDVSYLIETKWQKSPADVSDVDDLHTRLSYLPPSVTGLLVSYKGFTESARERVREKSHRPVVLLTGMEVESALDWTGDLPGLLARRTSALAVHREVQVNVDIDRRRRRRTKRAPSDLFPLPNMEFAFPDGSRWSWLQCEGEFGRFAFVHELFDIDWSAAPGNGVTLDLRLARQSDHDVRGLLELMASMGWVTSKGCWSIQQASANWHGFGAEALVEALDAWKERYTELVETHHTEEVCYLDQWEDGYYSLMAAISADSRRIVWQVELSFQLVGVPLDPSALLELAKHLKVEGTPFFRPRSEQSVIRGRPPEARPPLVPVAFVVTKRDADPVEEEWVCGVVVQNPYRSEHGSRRPEWVPDMLRASEYLICRLRSWHGSARPRSSYELWEFESAWTSDLLVLSVLADWPS